MCTGYFSERSSVSRAQAPKSYLRRRDLRNPEYGEEREHSLDLEVDAKRLDRLTLSCLLVGLPTIFFDKVSRARPSAAPETRSRKLECCSVRNPAASRLVI